MLTAQSLSGAGGSRSVTLPGTPATMVVTPDGTKGYLLDTNHGQVVPADLVHGTIGAPISAGKLPVTERLSPDGGTLYVTDNLGATVIPITTATNTVGTARALVDGADFYVPAPTGSSAVVSAYGSNGEPGAVFFYSPTTGVGSAIAVGMSSPVGLAYSADGKTVWVTEDGVGSQPGVVIPVDVATRAVGAPITVGHNPDSQAVSPDGHLLVTANGIDGDVTIVDLAKRAAVATIPVCAGPAGLSITADSGTAWITCELGATLASVNLTTYQAGKAIPLDNAPADIGLPRSGDTAWVLFPGSNGSVSFLSHANTLGTAIGVGNGPTVMIAHDSSNAWVANTLSNTVQRLDISGAKAGAPISVPQTPDDLWLTPDGKTLLILSFGNGRQPGFLSAITTATSKASPPLEVGIAPQSLTLSPDASTVFLAGHQTNSITTVDVKQWKVGSSIALPCSPSDLVITPSGSTLYAACDGSQQVIPITVATGKVGSPISVGASPRLVLGYQGKTLFILAAHELDAIDVATNTVTHTQPESGNIVGLVAAPDDSRLFGVDNVGGSLVFIDPSSLATTRSVLTGSRPENVAVSPNGSTAYVLDSSVQKLFVVDVSTGNVAASVSVAPNAVGLASPAPGP